MHKERIMPSLNEIIITRRRIKKSPLPVVLKKEFRFTFDRLIMKKTFTSKERQKNYERNYRVAGFSVSHLGFGALYQLFKEIFVGLDYYFKSDKANPFIIDCGSNIGMSILFFKKLYPQSEIIGFEPNDEAFGKLEENIKVNRLENVTVHKKAVSDQAGEITFYFDPENLGSLQMSTVKDRMPKRSQTVFCVALSSFITKDVDFLKLDVEGAELSLFRELEKANKLEFIKEMTIEYHHHIKEGVDELSQMLRILETNGFGYQISSDLSLPIEKKTAQDLMIYAYKK